VRDSALMKKRYQELIAELRRFAALRYKTKLFLFI